MAPEEEERANKGFKVQDRRRFSAEGELKPEFSGADEPAAAAQPASRSDRTAAHDAAAPDAAAPAPPERERQTSAASRQQRAAAKGYAAARGAGGPASDPAEAGEINFSAFLISLSTEALVHLGEMSDPAGGEAPRDLAMAQQLIDILGMLHDKTRGNLDHEEQSLLDAILFDLRMKYVEIARRNG